MCLGKWNVTMKCFLSLKWLPTSRKMSWGLFIPLGGVEHISLGQKSKIVESTGSSDRAWRAGTETAISVPLFY